MRKIELNLDEVVDKLVPSNPEIEIFVIEGLNHGEVCFLTQAPNDTWFWTELNNAFAIKDINGNNYWDTCKEAIYEVVKDNRIVFQFYGIKEFCHWYQERYSTKQKQVP